MYNNNNNEVERVTSTRQTFLKQSAMAAVMSLLVVVPTNGANAATYGGFGTSSPAVIPPSDAEIDDEIMASKPVQKAIESMKGYKKTVNTIQSLLEKDDQVNVRSIILKELDFASLRVDFNTYNTAFEEDTQRGTDRLIRVILQDITELELANNQKAGIPRSTRRVETMKNKLAKLNQAFDDLLAFAK